MVDSQEIIERSIYSSLLSVLVLKGYTLDPKDYQPITEASIEAFKADRQAILDDKGIYIELYGSSNNQDKSENESNRISIEPRGFLPGEVGFEKLVISDEAENNGSFLVSELPFEAIDQIVDIRLSYVNTTVGRTLLNVLNTAIPQRGYIKPYYLQEKPSAGNIFILLTNFLEQDIMNKGIIEKIYQYTIKDTLLSEPPVIDTVVPMTDISFYISDLKNSII